MGLTSGTKKILIPAILYLGGYVCALQFNLSVTLDPVLTVAPLFNFAFSVSIKCKDFGYQKLDIQFIVQNH